MDKTGEARGWSIKLAGIVSVVGMVVVNVSGFVDHATHSGLGCGADWPLCHGAVIPRLDNRAVQIEYLHRLLTLGFFAVLVVFLFKVWQQRRDQRWVVAEVSALVAEATLCTLGVLGPVPNWIMGWLAPVGLAAQSILAGLVWKQWRPQRNGTPLPRGWLWATGAVLSAYLYMGGWLSYHVEPVSSFVGYGLGILLVILVLGRAWLDSRHGGGWRATAVLMLWIPAPWVVARFAEPNLLVEMVTVLWLSCGTGAFTILALPRAVGSGYKVPGVAPLPASWWSKDHPS